MKYIAAFSGRWMMQNDAIKDFQETKDFDADSVTDLKEQFSSYLGDVAYERGYKSVSGMIDSVDVVERKTIASHKAFTGTFVNTEDVDIDLGT